jgi:hypothetical protein
LRATICRPSASSWSPSARGSGQQLALLGGDVVFDRADQGLEAILEPLIGGAEALQLRDQAIDLLVLALVSLDLLRRRAAGRPRRGIEGLVLDRAVADDLHQDLLGDIAPLPQSIAGLAVLAEELAQPLVVLPEQLDRVHDDTSPVMDRTRSAYARRVGTPLEASASPCPCAGSRRVMRAFRPRLLACIEPRRSRRAGAGGTGRRVRILLDGRGEY